MRQFTNRGLYKFRQWEVLERDAGAQGAVSAEIVPSLDVRELEESRLADVVELNPDQSIGQLRERVGCGNRCFLSVLNGAPAAYQWLFVNATENDIHLNTVTKMHVDFVLPRNWAYVWDTFTVPELRGRGIQPASMRVLIDRLFSRGTEGTAALVDANNRSSLRAFAKSGFRRRTSLWHLNILGANIILDRHRAGSVTY